MRSQLRQLRRRVRSRGSVGRSSGARCVGRGARRSRSFATAPAHMEHFEALQALLNETDYVGLAGGDHAIYHAAPSNCIRRTHTSTIAQSQLHI